MIGRGAKSLTISLPVEPVEQLDRLSRSQHGSRSALMRDAFRC
jgi:metal-responsive CopG/Arc/MetJ family transcriptional regulator